MAKNNVFFAVGYKMNCVKMIFLNSPGGVHHAPPCGGAGGTGNAFSCDFDVKQAEQSPEFFRAFFV